VLNLQPLSFWEKLKEGLSPSNEVDPNFVMVSCKINKFHLINRNYGFEAGDLIVERFNEIIKRSLPKNAKFCQIGNAFYFILSGSQQKAIPFCRRLLIACLKSTIPYKGHTLRFTPTIGLCDSTTLVEEHRSIEGVTLYANLALAIAEATPGTYIEVAGKDTAKVFNRIEIEKELTHSIYETPSDFKLYMQPIVRLGTKEVVGFECLLRWKESKDKRYQPLTFFPAAKDIGLLHKLEEVVIELACKLLAQMQEHPNTAGLFLSVNLEEIYQFDNFESVFNKAVSKSKVNPRLIHIEINERSSIKDLQDTTLLKLLTLNIKSIFVDDFGSGNAGFSWLLGELILDGIKVDRIFVEDIDKGDKKKEAIFKAILIVAYGAGLSVVVEGIEREEERLWICEAVKENTPELDILGQGYLFGKPLPIEKIIDVTG
jgi:EAL domain-containing protein (putative c-di-GMP-specific phosphodiesterase class I)/GGDEF domain-containing protein